MIYFLDFDNTLFNTPAFKSYLATRLGYESLENRAEELFGMVTDGTLTFAPGELSQFLYEDARTFLTEKENSAMIITYGNEGFQTAKVKSALHGIPRMSVMYTGSVRKGDYLGPHVAMYGKAVFTDDAPVELEIMGRECPDIARFEMRRDGGPGDGRWPVIHSLSELP